MTPTCGRYLPHQTSSTLERIASQAGATEMKVFGSVLSPGTFTSRSDIDIAIFTRTASCQRRLWRQLRSCFPQARIQKAHNYTRARPSRAHDVPPLHIVLLQEQDSNLVHPIRKKIEGGHTIWRAS